MDADADTEAGKVWWCLLWDGEASKGQNQVSSPIKANQSGQGTGKKSKTQSTGKVQKRERPNSKNTGNIRENTQETLE